MTTPCFLWDIYDNSTQSKTYLTVLHVFAKTTSLENNSESSNCKSDNANDWSLASATFELEYEHVFRIRIKDDFYKNPTTTTPKGNSIPFRHNKEGRPLPFAYEELNIKGLKTVRGHGFFDGYTANASSKNNNNNNNNSLQENDIFGECSCPSARAASEIKGQLRTKFGNAVEFFDSKLSTGEQFLMHKGITLFSWITIDAKVFHELTVSSSSSFRINNGNSNINSTTVVVNGKQHVQLLKDPPPISERLFLKLIHEHSILLHVDITPTPDGTVVVPRWTSPIAELYPGMMHLEELKIQDTQPIQKIAVMVDSSVKVPSSSSSTGNNSNNNEGVVEEEEMMYQIQELLSIPWKERSPWEKKKLIVWNTSMETHPSFMTSPKHPFLSFADDVNADVVMGKTETVLRHCSNESEMILSFLHWWNSCDASWKVAVICPEFLYSLQYIRERCEELGILSDFYTLMAGNSNNNINNSNNNNEDRRKSSSFSSSDALSVQYHFERPLISKHYVMENRNAIHHGGIPGTVLISVMDYWREFCRENSKELETLSKLLKKREEQRQQQQRQSLRHDSTPLASVLPMMKEIWDMYENEEQYMEWTWIYCKEIQVASSRDIFDYRSKTLYRLVSTAAAHASFFLPDYSPWSIIDGETKGGYTMACEPGLYSGPLYQIDFSSFYPSLVIDHNLCPTTMMLRVNNNNSNNNNNNNNSNYGSTIFSECHFVAFPNDSKMPMSNLCFVPWYRRVGILPEILKKMVRSRQEIKEQLRKMDLTSTDPVIIYRLKQRELAIKLVANACCGVFAQHTVKQGNPMECKPLAEAMTALGRMHLSKLIQQITNISTTIPIDAATASATTLPTRRHQENPPCHFKVLQAHTDGFLVMATSSLAIDNADELLPATLNHVLSEYTKEFEVITPSIRGVYAGLLLKNVNSYYLWDAKGTIVKAIGTTEYHRDIPIAARELCKEAAEFIAAAAVINISSNNRRWDPKDLSEKIIKRFRELSPDQFRKPKASSVCFFATSGDDSSVMEYENVCNIIIAKLFDLLQHAGPREDAQQCIDAVRNAMGPLASIDGGGGIYQQQQPQRTLLSPSLAGSSTNNHQEGQTQRKQQQSEYI